MWVVREQTGVCFNKPTSELNRLKKFGVRRNWCDVLTSVHDHFTSNHTCAVKGHQTMTLHQQILPLDHSGAVRPADLWVDRLTPAARSASPVPSATSAAERRCAGSLPPPPARRAARRFHDRR